MATELNNGITEENQKPYTIWAVITETEGFGKANIQLYYQHKNAKSDLAKTLWNLLTKENNKTGLSPEEKRYGMISSTTKAGYSASDSKTNPIPR